MHIPRSFSFKYHHGTETNIISEKESHDHGACGERWQALTKSEIHLLNTWFQNSCNYEFYHKQWSSAYHWRSNVLQLMITILSFTSTIITTFTLIATDIVQGAVHYYSIAAVGVIAMISVVMSLKKYMQLESLAVRHKEARCKWRAFGSSVREFFKFNKVWNKNDLIWWHLSMYSETLQGSPTVSQSGTISHNSFYKLKTKWLVPDIVDPIEEVKVRRGLGSVVLTRKEVMDRTVHLPAYLTVNRASFLRQSLVNENCSWWFSFVTAVDIIIAGVAAMGAYYDNAFWGPISSIATSLLVFQGFIPEYLARAQKFRDISLKWSALKRQVFLLRAINGVKFHDIIEIEKRIETLKADLAKEDIEWKIPQDQKKWLGRRKEMYCCNNTIYWIRWRFFCYKDPNQVYVDSSSIGMCHDRNIKNEEDIINDEDTESDNESDNDGYSTKRGIESGRLSTLDDHEVWISLSEDDKTKGIN